MQQKILKYFFYISFFGAIALIGFYGYIVLKYSTNAPFFDDFFWGFTFLDEYISADSFKEKIRLIFQQHAQHRIAYFRLFIVGHYHLLGTINFKNIAIFANISNLIVFAILVKLLFKHGFLKYLLLPIALVLFQFQYYQNIISSYGFPNMAVYMWVFLAFYFNSLMGRKNLIYTLLCAILAAFSNGNGVLAFPILLFFLFLQNRFADLKIAGLILGIFLLFYFALANDMATQPINVLNSANYLIKFLSAAFFTGHFKLEFLATVLMLICFIGLLLKDIYKRFFYNKAIVFDQIWLFITPVLLWILATALSVAVFRATPEANIPNWYFNYSILFIICFAIYFINGLKNSYLISFIVLGFTSYGISNYYKNLTNILPTIHGFHSNLEADIVNFKQHKKWSFLLTQVSYPMYQKFEKLTNKFYDKGIFKLDEVAPNLITSSSKTSLNTKHFMVEESINNELKVSFLEGKDLPENSFGFIKSATETYYFGVGKLLNNSKKEIIFGKALFDNKPFFVVGKTYFDIAIKAGEYNFGFVFFDKKGNQKWYTTEQKIKIENY